MINRLSFLLNFIPNSFHFLKRIFIMFIKYQYNAIHSFKQNIIQHVCRFLSSSIPQVNITLKMLLLWSLLIGFYIFYFFYYSVCLLTTYFVKWRIVVLICIYQWTFSWFFNTSLIYFIPFAPKTNSFIRYEY